MDFLAYLKDQALVGFMEAYFLLALVSHKSQLICCSDFINKALRWHWSKWSQTTNTKKGVMLSIANVWVGLLLSDLLLLKLLTYWEIWVNEHTHSSSLVQIIFTFWIWLLSLLFAIVLPLVPWQMPVWALARKLEFTVGSPEPGPFPGAQPPIGLG